MSSTFSPELTFLPLRHPHEITDKRKGARLIRRINTALAEIGGKTGVQMVAKLDPHHFEHTTKETYLVELNPFVRYFQLEWANPKSTSHAVFTAGIDEIIGMLRKRFKLVPSLVKRRGDTDLHVPQGGCHCHLGADVFHYRTDWYRTMERFHRNLATDYANRPYARWLLAHWMSQGSHVMFDRERLDIQEQDSLLKVTRDALFQRALFGSSAIEPRFMASMKNSYLTFEFRIVGMVENARQLCAAVRLLRAWMRHIECLDRPLRFNLTTAKWDAMTKEDSARELCRSWVVDTLGLDWADYEADFFQRNYLLRIQHGTFD